MQDVTVGRRIDAQHAGDRVADRAEGEDLRMERAHESEYRVGAGELARLQYRRTITHPLEPEPDVEHP